MELLFELDKKDYDANGTVTQKLDKYEAEEEFSLEFPSINDAIEKNQQALRTTLIGDEFYTIMIEREVKVLQLIQRNA